ncbi:hypothetical protein B2M27_15660 (plasmid) [Kluyvera intermedia]|uniref:Uncharacterized protein n=1 Tax=Kluyvera intermedia TaxID=61648 RepID=A0ABX3UD88_KLUIN|nr:hypothetical protein B2M27_15660 [Kluyvera intermedia]
MTPVFSFHIIASDNCHHSDNMQTYSHSVKLPDGRSGQIRLSGIFELSGSVPRIRNKQSVLLWGKRGRSPGRG